MGYYSYQHGLINRHFEQRGAWEKHNENCRSYILNAIELFKPEKLTVLGSGWLLDLPLAEMTERISSIDLVDIIHPPDVSAQVSGYTNVKLIEADVTGGLIRQVWEKSRKYLFRKMKSLAEITVPDFIPGTNPGLIISLNILTQLENLPVELIRKKAVACEEEIVDFRKMIQKKHIDFLQRHRAVLITDTDEIFYGNNGAETIVPTLLADLPSFEMKQEWIWNFDPRSDDYYNKSSVLRVIALTF